MAELRRPRHEIQQEMLNNAEQLEVLARRQLSLVREVTGSVANWIFTAHDDDELFVYVKGKDAVTTYKNALQAIGPEVATVSGYPTQGPLP